MKDATKTVQMYDLDDTDKKILKTLLLDSRLSYREIARRNKLAVSTVIDRFSKLRHNGIIDGFSLRINPAKLGYGLTTIITVSMPKGLARHGMDEIAKLPNVHAIYETTGRFDSFVIAKFKDMSEMHDFLRDLHEKEFVRKTETHVVLRSPKEDFRVLI